MQRYDIINEFIKKYNYTTYVEIGVQKNKSFSSVNCDNKVGIDPDPDSNPTFCMTSDEYFKKHKDKADVYFIDGMHEETFVYRDINNALERLNDNGTIVCHDMNPQNEIEQRVPRETKRWNGNCFKALVKLRTERDDLEIYTVDTDEGCAVIRKGSQEKLDISGKGINYDNLSKYRKKWLNLISVDEFKKVMGITDPTYSIWQFQPYSLNKDYGDSCNKYFELVPSDDDWVVICDSDIMFLTPAHIHKIKEYIDAYPDTGLFTCFTNRVKQKLQVYDMKNFENPDVKFHQKLAVELSKKPMSVKELNIVISGYIMIMKKATWKLINGFPSGILGVDNKVSNRVMKAGLKILLMETVYGFHYYRMNTNINDASHIR
jgi:prolyl oligopeptidase PreP (S9A serine peptidase family)